MNELGNRKIPFLFVVDFEMQQPLLFTLDEIPQDDLWYEINGKGNAPSCKGTAKDFFFHKYPIGRDEYACQFTNVMKNISYGNSYLLNLTCETPVEINLMLQEIFLYSKAKYKLWYKDEFVCFSPEPFIKIKNGEITSFPMKGTIDASVPDAVKVIMEDKKETAEHYTIVDLIRNDLSMVASNVGVEKFRYIDRLQTNNGELLQVSSAIKGVLPADYASTIGDLIFKLLPAGSVSGAPKRKTVEIILETETYRRGYYTGIFGLFDGYTLDSGVLIRFIQQTSGGLVFKSGGGITSFSRLSSEYNEMIDKVYVPITGNH